MSEFIKGIIGLHYGIEVFESKKLTVGAGSNTYDLLTDSGRYILKNANVNEANNPQNEPPLCAFLLSKGIPVSEFVKCTNGDFLFAYDGHRYHMQRFVEGICYEWNTAPDWLLTESAKVLGEIHAALADYPPLPVGIGECFFQHMTPEMALRSYEKSFQRAKVLEDSSYVEGIAYRMDLMKRLQTPSIRLDQLTRRNTHGDYFISQLLCGDRQINTVIDWTTACVHPVVWEVLRSYVYAAPECSDGRIDMASFIDYVKTYLTFATLNKYDIKMLPYVFYYQIAVCDYYGQYYQSDASNREIYLQQAILSTKLMRWFDINAEEFSVVLKQELGAAV
jgi:Ser/Thr protein kinase RdoA (MazF antagonist)